LHITHDCNTNHGSCRCAFLKGFRQPVQLAKGTVYTTDFGIDDIFTLILYFCQEQREPAYLFINDRRTSIPTDAALLQNAGHRGSTRKGAVGESLRRYNLPLWSTERCASATSCDVQGTCERNAKRKWICVGEKSLSYEEKMYNFIMKYDHVPIDSILRSGPWLNSRFRFIRSLRIKMQPLCRCI
jgi:hypothetical protein